MNIGIGDDGVAFLEAGRTPMTGKLIQQPTQYAPLNQLKRRVRGGNGSCAAGSFRYV